MNIFTNIFPTHIYFSFVFFAFFTMACISSTFAPINLNFIQTLEKIISAFTAFRNKTDKNHFISDDLSKKWKFPWSIMIFKCNRNLNIDIARRYKPIIIHMKFPISIKKNLVFFSFIHLFFKICRWKQLRMYRKLRRCDISRKLAERKK